MYGNVDSLCEVTCGRYVTSQLDGSLECLASSVAVERLVSQVDFLVQLASLFVQLLPQQRSRDLGDQLFVIQHLEVALDHPATYHHPHVDLFVQLASLLQQPQCRVSFVRFLFRSPALNVLIKVSCSPQQQYIDRSSKPCTCNRYS